MDILEIFNATNDPRKTGTDLENILKQPEICGLLTHYYQSILDLKPVNKHHGIDEKRLAITISWAFSKITVMISSSNDAGLSEIIFNVCCMLISKLTREFESHGESLDNMITGIITDYCTMLPVCEDELIALFREQINKNNTLTGTNKTSRRSSSNNSLICYNKEVENSIVVELDLIGWIYETGSARVLFSNNDEIIHIMNKRLSHLALFLRKAREAHLIQPEFGTGYIEIVSKHLFYLGKPVRKKYFKRLCSEVWKNAKNNYDDEHNTVSRIIDRIIKVRNTESQM